jgi:hypothetical protein
MRRMCTLAAIGIGAASLAGASAHGAMSGTQCLVINEVYSAGGSVGATYNRNFIELLDRCTTGTSLNGVYLDVLSGDGAWQVSVALSGSVGAGHFFLIGFNDPALGGPLPAPDASYPIMMAPGKAYLTTDPSSPTACPSGPSLIDLVGYGSSSAPCFEGAGPAPASTATRSASRTNCVDADDNAADFILGDPSPKNTSSPPISCGIPTAALVTSLTATRERSRVVVRWVAHLHPGLLGYELYRLTDRGSRLLTPHPVLAPGGRAQRLEWVDREARRASGYRLEAVGLDGGRTVVGSVAVR